MLSDLKRLTTKQRKFCDYYIQNGNATKSAIRAGYSKRSARQIGNRLLSKHYISEYVQSRLKKIDAKAKSYVNKTKADAIKAKNADKHVHKTVPLVPYLKKIVENTASKNSNRSARN